MSFKIGKNTSTTTTTTSQQKIKKQFNWSNFGQGLFQTSSKVLESMVMLGMTKDMLNNNNCIWSQRNSCSHYGLNNFGCGSFGYGIPVQYGMYSDMTDPRLTQMGLYEATAQAEMEYNAAYQRVMSKLAEYRTSKVGQQELTQAEELHADFNDKGIHSFVSDEWKSANAQTEKTEEEKSLLKAQYQTFLNNLCNSWYNYIDNLGTKDSKATLEEFKKYINEKYPDKGYTNEEVQKIYDELSLFDQKDGFSNTDIKTLINRIDGEENPKGILKKSTIEDIFDILAKRNI